MSVTQSKAEGVRWLTRLASVFRRRGVAVWLSQFNITLPEGRPGVRYVLTVDVLLTPAQAKKLSR